METVLAAIAIILFSGIISLIFHRSPIAASIASVIGIVIGCIVGLVPVVQTLISGAVFSIQWPWGVPGGILSFGLDPVSALFLLVIFGISAPVSVYGGQYLWPGRKEHNLGVTWFFTSVLIVAMAVVVIARNSVLFLIAWEVMSLSSFFLVMTEHKRSDVRVAGWTYLVAAHIGTAFLLAFFILIGQHGSLDFEHFTPTAHAGLLFVLSVIGFGTKAGFVPLHVWLPEAHPAAPSHISALMSGVMIKMGIYGIVRTLTFLGTPPEWWGWLLLGIGLISGLLGVLFAIAQHDLKRLLAYHSVENIGIIAIGLGIGLLGVSYQSPILAVLGFGGGLLHVVNHALFKGLLFLGAGAVAQSSGTREIDKLGGLLKKMPWTGITFLVGSIAICGLPPLNGFISEFLIYIGAFHISQSFHSRMAVASLITVGGLSLIGGLALACFTKAFGIVFLGEPRTEHKTDIHEVGMAMKIPMVILAAGCLIVGVAAPLVIKMLIPAIVQVSQLPIDAAEELFAQGMSPLYRVVMIFSICCGLIALIAFIRFMLLRNRKIGTAVTWDCGYAQPTTRMQYTASSFAQPLTDLFQSLLRTRSHLLRPKGVFPKAAAMRTHTPDIFQQYFFRPIFFGVDKVLGYFRWLQHGNVNLYILYILITLLTLMFWKLK
jgi:hydrogenase-4 component B